MANDYIDAESNSNTLQNTRCKKGNVMPKPEDDTQSKRIFEQTALEKRQQRIQALENKLQRERNRLSSQYRKTRNGQLISWGVMVEAAYRQGTPEQRTLLNELAVTYLSDERNRWRAQSGFERIKNEAGTQNLSATGEGGPA